MANEMETFAKFSAKLYLNDKIQEFAQCYPRAAWLWVNAIIYAVDRKTDGMVSAFAATRYLAAAPDDLEALEAAGLFEPVEGGWMIHDFLKSQVSVEEQDELKAKRAEAGRKGGKKSGEVRAVQANAKQNEANAKQTLKQNEAEIETETDITPYSPPAGDDGTKLETESEPEGCSEPDGFDAVWQAYPKHTGKPKAVRAYAATLNADANPKLLLDAATSYATKVEHGEVEARWVPTLANWLANDVWRDHTPKAKAKPVELPSESWLQANFDEPLLALGLDSVEALMRRRQLFAMIRDGTPPSEAAQRIINETKQTSERTQQ